MHVVPESELSLMLAPVPPRVTEVEFRRCRNDIVRALVSFGSVGPTGVHDESDNEVESFGGDGAAFFVVEDMYNDEQRLHLIETDAHRITEALLESLCHAVALNQHWAAHLALGGAGLYLFADRVLPCGRRFWDCNSAGEIVERCSRAVDFGPVPDVWSEGYEIWEDLVCGTWHRDQLPVGPDRQWTYILNYLSQTRNVSEFTYKGRVIYDLHPATRREFVLRFLDRASAGDQTSMVGIETVAQDAGRLLSELDGAASNDLLGGLATAQVKLPRKEAFYFWTRVIYGLSKGVSLGAPPSIPITLFLSAKTVPPGVGIVSLSAILGLACLKDPEVPERATQLSLMNPQWGVAIHSWLRKLGTNRDAYPYPSSDLEWLTIE